MKCNFISNFTKLTCNPSQISLAVVHNVHLLHVQCTQSGTLTDNFGILRFNCFQAILGEGICSIVHDALVIVVLTKRGHVTVRVQVKVVRLPGKNIIVVDFDVVVPTGVRVRVEESQGVQHFVHRNALGHTSRGGLQVQLLSATNAAHVRPATGSFVRDVHIVLLRGSRFECDASLAFDLLQGGLDNGFV